MDNYFFSDEMLSDSFGTYNAAAMRIKITKTADSKPINHQKFSLLSNFDCTTLFHEYIHHLQNTSTITGVQHLDLLVSMWQNTRNYIDKENDIGSYERSKSAFIKSFEYNDNNKSIRNRKKEFFIHSFNDLSATFRFFLNSAPPPENISQPASITCMQGENEIIVKFGIYEFQEGCAHLMEKILCEKIQLEADKYNADLIPYKIILYIRDYLFIKCINENLIAIMLAAMQHAACCTT